MDNEKIDDLQDEAIKGLLKNLSAKSEPTDNDEVRKNLMNNELKFSKTIQNIPLSELIEVDESINFFKLPTDEEFIELAHSIEIYGVINPLIVRFDETNKLFVNIYIKDIM